MSVQLVIILVLLVVGTELITESGAGLVRSETTAKGI